MQTSDGLGRLTDVRAESDGKPSLAGLVLLRRRRLARPRGERAISSAA